MENLEETLKNSHDWALRRMNVLSEGSDVNKVNDAMSIHREFKEWFDPKSEDHDIFSLEFIGEGSEYAE
jgi:hypothetical protein